MSMTDSKILKCDNPDCNYKRSLEETEDIGKYIDALCPKCGEPLLTQPDFVGFKIITLIGQVIDILFGENKQKTL